MNSRRLAKMSIRKGAVQKAAELSPLISVLKRRKLRTIVEIGTNKGGTFFVWCRISQPDALIVSIDLPGGPFGGGCTKDDIKKIKKYKKRRQKVYFLRKNSHKKATREELLKILTGRKIDLLFIDGDHTYNGVKRDWHLYSPLIKKNGLAVLHDILFHPKVPKCKVDVFWKEIKNHFKHKEFIYRHDDRGWGQWGGIGIIYFALP
jgi:23S rRNA U2552 (ribose-2'-O)-methylase RlmE/FtsJ